MLSWVEHEKSCVPSGPDLKHVFSSDDNWGENLCYVCMQISEQIESWAQDCSNSNIFLKPLFRGNIEPFVNNANLGAIAHASLHGEEIKYWEKQPSDLLQSCDQPSK